MTPTTPARSRAGSARLHRRLPGSSASTARAATSSSRMSSCLLTSVLVTCLPFPAQAPTAGACPASTTTCRAHRSWPFGGVWRARSCGARRSRTCWPWTSTDQMSEPHVFTGWSTGRMSTSVHTDQVHTDQVHTDQDHTDQDHTDQDHTDQDHTDQDHTDQD